MHEDARKIIKQTIADVMPDRAVRNSLNELQLNGNIYIIAIGKAAWGEVTCCCFPHPMRGRRL